MIVKAENRIVTMKRDCQGPRPMMKARLPESQFPIGANLPSLGLNVTDAQVLRNALHSGALHRLAE